MKKQFAILLMGIFLIQFPVFGYNLELNMSYDYFRGMPDGSWNGNSGGFLAANFGTDVYDCANVQVGASYGLYNWDGRENLVFRNPKAAQREAFVTAGLSSSLGQFNAGLVYDRVFTNHFGIYDLSPSVDQLRFQTGYQKCREEYGMWGTVYLSNSRKSALGVPITFRAINQINLFWSHLFENCAKTTIWLGTTYSKSLMYHHRTPGKFTAGFSVRMPLTERFFIDGHGSYMAARTSSGTQQTRKYASNICIGITYLFGNECPSYGSTYMEMANNSNFLIDTNINQ